MNASPLNILQATRRAALTTSPASGFALKVFGTETPIPVNGRPLELARLLMAHRGGLTRLQMVFAEFYALGLDAPSIVRRLRKVGVPIESIPEKGEDRSARPVTFVRYRLGANVRLVQLRQDAEAAQ
ncbi:hypothetical protein GXW71_28245 [Roseomonas hellenica]|uniref:Helix-turn-helix domain-containing protein n=1 Tax=Plastoroseomonas hellenica TaxID=2687306 RepID=A0ABS5F709_9PROT|nr:hypothetical protein [Plastoroseomonas hellenica]MBR0668276.1 hypothetical protein [Plastoroseomonas hellenica]